MGAAQPGEGLDELVLAVAGHARHPEDLTGPNVEGDALDGLVATVVADVKVLDLEDRSAADETAPVHGEADLPPDHELGQVLLVRLGRASASRRPDPGG